MNLFVGRVEDVRETKGARWAMVSVRGARTEVALDLVPGARVGDAVLVHAGVALALLRADPSAEEEAPCV